MFVIDEISHKKRKVSISELKNSEYKNLDDFEFDWEKEKIYKVFKLHTIKSHETLGLMSIDFIFDELRIEIRLLELSGANIGSQRRFSRIAGNLIAFACKESFLSGFYGFVSLIPKTNLIDHYVDKYGFTQYGRHLAIDLKSSENLMKEYLSNE